MPEPTQYKSPANLFLEEEVYQLGSCPGVRSLPPGAERDFLTLSWGPIVYRTSYAPETKRLLPVFLRCLNDAVSRSLPRTLIGSDEEIQTLKSTYSSRFFNAQDRYGDLDVEAVRQAFHEFKAWLGIPETELPSRLRICLMVDNKVLSHLKAMLDLSSMAERDANLRECWVNVVEENFPDSRMDDHPHAVDVKMESSRCMKEYRGTYNGSTMVALDALVEVFDGIRQMKRLVDYHREGRVYLGEGKWSS
ncbi:hypothetical protein N7535_000185 [Penicillium sp. DV-2018c]|nr:hypothetical protein N7535_000185 [Penicillium sp. DV-2018c]